jgi:nucleotide-binding universal stress UspA family protein
MKRILAAVDGSPAALKAVAFAADLASRYDAELVVLTVAAHVAPVVDHGIDEYARIEGIRAPAAEYGFSAAQGALDEACRTASEGRALRPTTVLAVGDPATEIISAAKDRKADLIVVGSHGQGRLAGLLLGSVAQKVVGLASCPVAVVR